MEFIKMVALVAVLSYSALSAYDQPMQKLEAALAGKGPDHVPSRDEGPWALIDAGAVPSAAAADGGEGGRLARRVDQTSRLMPQTRNGAARVPQVSVADLSGSR